MKKHKKLIIISLSLLLVLGIVLVEYGYFSNNFEGKVISKDTGGCLDICLAGPPKYVVVSYWQGEKQFTTNDKSYAKIQVGKTYSFNKDLGTDLITLK